MLLIEVYPYFHIPVMIRDYTILAYMLTIANAVDICSMETSFVVFTNFTVDGESLNRTTSNVAICRKHCVDVEIPDIFSFNADNGVCKCYTWPVHLTHMEHAVPLYISGK